MKAALTGHYTQEGLFVLRQSLDAWKFHQKQLQECDIERAAYWRLSRRPTPLPPLSRPSRFLLLLSHRSKSQKRKGRPAATTPSMEISRYGTSNYSASAALT